MIRRNSFYRWIGDALVTELMRGLQDGKHYALLGQRHGAKGWVLELLSKRAAELPENERPRIVCLGWSVHQQCGSDDFLIYLATCLGLPDMEPDATDARLSGGISARVMQAMEIDSRPLWIFVQDVLGFPKQIARELLLAFNSLHEQQAESGASRRFGVVVTGSSEFISLTINPNSPYRHADMLLTRGLDYDYAQSFFIERRRRLFGPDADTSVPPEVFDYLYQMTEGNAHLLQELAAAPAHHPYLSDDCSDVYRSRAETERMVDHFIRNFMRDDHYSSAMLHEAEQDPEWFEMLLEVLHNQSVRLPRGNPHGMEVCGLLAREQDGIARFSCAMVRSFVENTLNPRHIADVYAALRRWQNAWPAYQKLEQEFPELRDRPMSGYAQEHLRDSILVWKDQLMDEAQRSVGDVVTHFLAGMRHLFGFDWGGLVTRLDPHWIETGAFACADVAVPQPPHDLRTEPDCVPSIQGEQRILWCVIPATGCLPEWPKPLLFLQRDLPGREIDTTERSVLQNALARFCHAYKAAEEIEYRRRIGELREKHLLVIEQVNNAVLEMQFDMGHVARRTTEALVREAGYHRVLLCLVNARRDHIQAVASCHQIGAIDFLEKTNFDLSDPEADIQAWVVANKQSALVPDAGTWNDSPFRINREQVDALGIKAFAVVPLITGGTVVGTLHIERADLQPPGSDERDLYLILAGHIAGVFRQAQRLELLHAAIGVLEDEVRIIDPAFRLVYLNRAAAATESTTLSVGWQTDPVLCDWNKHAWARNQPNREEVEAEADQKVQIGDPARYFLTSREGRKLCAQSLEMSRILDFRANLAETFEADGNIGLVEHIRDMTPLYELLVDQAEWLRKDSVVAAAQAIVDTVVKYDYAWCRIYRLISHPERGRLLQSLTERGLKRAANRQDFMNGALIQEEDEHPRTSAWYALKEARRPAIFELVPDPEAHPTGVVEAPDLEGAERYYTTTGLEAPQLEAADVRRWIEAPLMVGDRPIGVMELSLPASPLTPRRWALLGTFVQNAALTLDGMIRAEDKAALERQTAEAMIWIFHQFRQPLFACRGQLRLLKRQLQSLDSAHASKHLGLVEEALTQMERISADYRSHIATYIPNLVVEDIVAGLRETCGRAQNYSEQVEIRWRPDVEHRTVKTDHGELRTITDELIYNAIKALKSANTEEPWVQVRLDTTSEAEAIQIFVEDNGPGVPNNIRDRLYEPDPNKSSGGTGFGLANVKKHLDILNATIKYLDREPHGARFCVRVPIVAAIDQEGASS